MFSKVFLSLRKKSKLTQSELADKIGLSRAQVANYELGTREPDLNTLIKIADYFSVTTDFLLGREMLNDIEDTFDFNERLLKEICNLRQLEKTVGATQRISTSLEILRLVRNSELELTFEEGLKQENEWIEKKQSQ
ncbi:helix-turn-helix domain-containing protein [Lysinibacillus xylanilyticus]|uniref:helix-turn-helix domain-containing protein n=1 Tax=Lysinibacillus xylanilyticus TaxID=582475 RepID=UPI00382F13E1